MGLVLHTTKPGIKAAVAMLDRASKAKEIAQAIGKLQGKASIICVHPFHGYFAIASNRDYKNNYAAQFAELLADEKAAKHTILLLEDRRDLDWANAIVRIESGLPMAAPKRMLLSQSGWVADPCMGEKDTMIVSNGGKASRPENYTKGAFISDIAGAEVLFFMGAKADMCLRIAIDNVKKLLAGRKEEIAFSASPFFVLTGRMISAYLSKLNE